MNYAEGIRKMKKLAEELKLSGESTASFRYGNLLIAYPGYKKHGDYKLTENGIAPKHTDVVKEIFEHTAVDNFDTIVRFLDDVYHNGMRAQTVIFSEAFKEKLFWITLQEEINYPQPAKAGRKLPFQRFYEAALAKLGAAELSEVLERTNNHGKAKPELFMVKQFRRPSFYK